MADRDDTPQSKPSEPADGEASEQDSSAEPLPEAPDPAEMLTLRPPLEEFTRYARERAEVLGRLAETERAELCVAALELGRRILEELQQELAHCLDLELCFAAWCGC